MSTYLEIINEVLRRSGQETVTTLVNPQSPVRQVMDFANDIYFEILEGTESQFLETSTTFNTVVGTAAYTVAADADVSFLLPDRIRLTTSDRYLLQVDPTLMLANQLADTGKPIRFWIEGGKIRLHPVPNAIYTVEYYYLKRPSKLVNNADQSLIPAAWERLLIRGAQSLTERFLGEVENSRASFGLYLEGLSLLKSKTQIKPYHTQKPFYRGAQSP